MRKAFKIQRIDRKNHMYVFRRLNQKFASTISAAGIDFSRFSFSFSIYDELSQH